MRTLFAVAVYLAPSAIFLDEVDSLLTQRKEDDNEASRGMKTEFLKQLDGVGNERQGQILVIGATNLPWELDDAVLRPGRFEKKLYIPLPDQAGREALMRNLLAKERHSLKDEEITKLSDHTDGFSGADLKKLCAEAAMYPLRKLGERFMSTRKEDIPPITYKHFRKALRGMSPSVAQESLASYEEWNDACGDKHVNCSDDDESSDDESLGSS